MACVVAIISYIAAGRGIHISYEVLYACKRKVSIYFEHLIKVLKNVMTLINQFL